MLAAKRKSRKFAKKYSHALLRAEDLAVLHHKRNTFERLDIVQWVAAGRHDVSEGSRRHHSSSVNRP